MKKQHFILYIFCMCWLLECMGCSYTYRTLHNREIYKSEDSVIFSKWGDNGRYLMDNKKFGRIYRLSPLTPSLKSNTIAGFQITDTMQHINDIQGAALLFALRSSQFYSADTTLFKTVFAPFIAVEIKGKHRYYLLLSYNSRELALASDSMVIERKRYDNHKFFLSLGLSLMPNDSYLKTNYELSK